MKKILLITGLSLSFISVISAATLELKSEANVVGSKIRLADVLLSATDVPSGILERDLGGSPAFGQERLISRAVVENVARDFNIQWTGATQCKVKRPSALASGDKFKEIIEDELRKLTQNQGEVSVVEFADARPFNAPAGGVEVKVTLPANVLNSSWSTASVRYMWNGETLLLRTVRFRWCWERGVWLANRAMDPGMPLRAEDFTEVVQDILKYSGNAFVGNLVSEDMILGRSLQPGAVLTRQAMRDRTLVHRGNQVVVNYQTQALRIEMKGTALEDGARGQLVAVRNDISKRKVYARVAGEGILEYEN
ncbi:MAG: flagellar basal body P-ring formation chaperone FlgA [Verrucomicrobiota bacterium]